MQKQLNEEYAKQIKTAEAIATLGNDLFGQQVNCTRAAPSSRRPMSVCAATMLCRWSCGVAS